MSGLQFVVDFVPESVDGAVMLRNFAAADPARVTQDHAVRYVALIYALLYAIVTEPERSITEHSQVP